MIACLPMYDWQQTASANDRLWSLVRARLTDAGIATPERLTRDGDLWEMWQSPELILAQTCGMPYRTRLHETVQLVATPDYKLPDAPPGYYYSVFTTRAGESGEVADFIERRLAYNDAVSQSGWAAPQNEAARMGARFDHVIQTGAHRDSARAVAEGRADIAAIDAVTWRLIVAHLPELAARLRVISHSDPTPGLPLITATGQNRSAIAYAVAAAIDGLEPEERSILGLSGIVHIPASAYLAVPTPPPPPHSVVID